jgi:hypothetical protein
MAESIWDLTTPSGVLRYLSPTPFAASKVIQFEEGVSNFIYRITLKEPYSVVGKAGLIHTMVLKHVEPHVRNSTFPLPVERQVPTVQLQHNTHTHPI